MAVKTNLKKGLLFFLLFFILVSTASAQQTLSNHEEFENGGFNKSFWYLASAGNSYNGQVSTNYADSGTHSYRLELRSTDRNSEGSKRSELESHPEPALQEGIYNFSEYFVDGDSEDWAVDNPGCGEVVAQWHQNPDSGDTLDCGAPLTLNVFPNTKDGQTHWILSSLYDERANTNSYTGWDANTHFIEYDLGPITKGQWVHWSFHIKWGWLPSQNPFLKVYRNGVLVVNNTRPNTFNDQKGVNQQIGIYKPGWNENHYSKLTSRVIYLDDISTSYVRGNTQTPTTPTITWSNPANITYGTPLSSTQLNAKASVQGTFTYTPSSGTVLGVGIHTLHVSFTPLDMSLYNTASKDVLINVNKAVPVITWNNPADVRRGTALSSTQLNAKANTPGTFIYNPAAETTLNVGTHTLHVDFAPSDTTNYVKVSKDVTINVIDVQKMTPTITWNNPADVRGGTALSSTQLNATASVPGSFNYTPPAGTVLSAGSHKLHVDFIPTDAAHYTNVSKDVIIKVISTVPLANYSASPTQGKSPLKVEFTDKSIGNITFWNWSFGDGCKSKSRNVSHTYYRSGTYTVKLTVSNSLGSSTVSKTIKATRG